MVRENSRREARVLYTRLCHSEHWSGTTAKLVWDIVAVLRSALPWTGGAYDDDIPF